MMIREFEELTGLEPTQEEYAVIELMYYDFEGTKRDFCENFTQRNGMEEVRRRIISSLHDELKKTIRQLHEAEALARSKDEEITRLTAALEKEQEWQPYEDPHNVSQADYEKLEAAGARELTDEEAADMIASEFGFDPSKIVIVHEVAKEEINRHRQIRKAGTLPRKALFEAWDWNYIVFNVKGNVTRGYEMSNGELKQYWA